MFSWSCRIHHCLLSFSSVVLKFLCICIFQARVDHRSKSLSFGTDLGLSQKEEVAEGPTIQSMPSELIRNQLTAMAQALNHAVEVVGPKNVVCICLAAFSRVRFILLSSFPYLEIKWLLLYIYVSLRYFHDHGVTEILVGLTALLVLSYVSFKPQTSSPLPPKKCSPR